MGDPSSGDPLDVTNGYNAYLQGAQVANPVGGNNITNTVFDWQLGAFGRFYYYWNSSLVDAGSRTANLVGLYHFTTAAYWEDSKELNSKVDIGYHYVANTSGIPTDTDGDGLPDYAEDRNGNGTVENGESDWQSASDQGLGIWISRPIKHSIAP
jgi:hypothetical protein